MTFKTNNKDFKGEIDDVFRLLNTTIKNLRLQEKKHCWKIAQDCTFEPDR